MTLARVLRIRNHELNSLLRRSQSLLEKLWSMLLFIVISWNHQSPVQLPAIGNLLDTLDDQIMQPEETIEGEVPSEEQVYEYRVCEFCLTPPCEECLGWDMATFKGDELPLFFPEAFPNPDGSLTVNKHRNCRCGLYPISGFEFEEQHLTEDIRAKIEAIRNHRLMFHDEENLYLQRAKEILRGQEQVKAAEEAISEDAKAEVKRVEPRNVKQMVFAFERKQPQLETVEKAKETKAELPEEAEPKVAVAQPKIVEKVERQAIAKVKQEIPEKKVETEIAQKVEKSQVKVSEKASRKVAEAQITITEKTQEQVPFQAEEARQIPAQIEKQIPVQVEKQLPKQAEKVAMATISKIQPVTLAETNQGILKLVEQQETKQLPAKIEKTVLEKIQFRFGGRQIRELMHMGTPQGAARLATREGLNVLGEATGLAELSSVAAPLVVFAALPIIQKLIEAYVSRFVEQEMLRQQAVLDQRKADKYREIFRGVIPA